MMTTATFNPLRDLKDFEDHEVSGLVRVLNELLEKAGIHESVYIAGVKPEARSIVQFSPATATCHPMKANSNVLIVNERLIKEILPGTDFSNYHSLGPEIRGLLAHEIGHLKMRDLKFPFGIGMISSLAPWIGLAGATAGMALIDHQKHTKALPTQDDVKQFSALPDGMQSPTLNAMGQIVKYMLTGVGGFVVGSAISIGINHHMEYRADRFSKNLLQSGEGLANFFERMQAWETGLLEGVFANQTQYTREQWDARNRFERLKLQILHPSIDHRISALRG